MMTAKQTDTDIVDWNPVSATVSHLEPTRGVRRYGVGAIFNPTDWSGAADDNLAGALRARCRSHLRATIARL